MLNKVTLIGRLGSDPEVKSLPSGSTVTNISLATNRNWNDRQTGEKHEETEWHRITFFQRLAEIAGEYLRKGSLIYVEGRIRTRKWQDQNGNDRYTTEIIAELMKMLESKSGGTGSFSSTPPNSNHSSSSQTSSVNTPPDNQQPASDEDFNDDIPF